MAGNEGMYKPHDHLHSPMKVGDWVVYMSGSMGVVYHINRGRNYVPKELGVYLDTLSWGRLYKVNPPRLGRVPRIPTVTTKSGEAIFISWPDMGEIGNETFRRLIGRVGREIKEGREVEIGCVGAHGRTGTLLAGLLHRVEKLPPGEAIKEVRRRYCDRAVESAKQENMIYRLAGEPVPNVIYSHSRSNGYKRRKVRKQTKRHHLYDYVNKFGEAVKEEYK